MTPAMELLLIVGLGAFLGLALWVAQRPGQGPAALWICGWFAAGVSGVLLLAESELGWLQVAAFPLGTLFAFLLLAGAIALGEKRRTPPWLIPTALGLGGARAALAATGHVQAAYAGGLAIEPAVVLAGGWVASRAARRAAVGRSQPFVLPCFAVLAAGGAFHLGWLMLGRDPASALVPLWMLVTPPALALQLHVSAARTRRALRRAHDDLERRVAERTAELASANAALRVSEERHRTISELSSDFSFAFRLDRELRLTREWVSGAFQRITGAGPEALDGHGWLAFLTPERRDALRSEYEETRDGSRVVERPIRTADGGERRLEIRVHTLSGGEDGSMRIVGAARDVTDVRRAEAERRELERHVHETERLESLGRLSGGIAHDFNNLLSVVLGNVGLLAADLPPDALARARLARIRTAADHAARLTEQMLIYAGKAPTNRKVIDVARVVREMLELVRAVLPESCELELALEPGARVEGDETQLRQVILNLVTNAAEALEGGRGRVRLRVGHFAAAASDLAGAHGAPDPAPGEYVLLEVADDGCGMDSATRERLFEPFYSTKFPGRGMGLASVLGIVRAHGGVVTLASEPARGTAVRVLLPPAKGGEARIAPAEAERARGPGGRILVVDDDPAVLEVAAELLGRAGFEVLSASGGRAAIERLRADPGAVDAVLLDLAMPDLGGEQVFLELREIRPGLPIVLATGYSEELASRRFSASGAAGFLRKPFEAEQLAACLHAALEKARLST
jgi:PAS domain S-box-containing protein